MDIDIDFPTTFDPMDHFNKSIRASMVKDGNLKKHPCGVYFQNIPKDNITNLSAIPYNKAEDIGYMKIDFLHIALLDCFENKKQIQLLIKKEPDWAMLENKEIVETLFQIHKHFTLVDQIKPTSVIELADTIALLRPGKRKLLYAYLKNKEVIRPELYRKPEENEGYYFKKSHAVAYALTVVLQLHLIKAKII